MNFKQKRALQAFRRAHGWLESHPELVASTTTTAGNTPATKAAGTTPAGTTPAGTAAAGTAAAGTAPAPLAKQFEWLGTVIDDLSASASRQAEITRNASATVADAQRIRRELILYYMRPLATVARVAIPNVVRMSESLRMPSQGKDIEGLLIAADAMAAAALPWQTELEERGLPAGFFDTFDQAVTDLRDAVDTRGQALGNRKGDTNRLRAGVTDGRKHMDAIDALITRELKDDPSTLAEWKHVRRATLKAVPGSAAAA